MRSSKQYIVIFLLLLLTGVILYPSLIKEPRLRKELLTRGRYTIATVYAISKNHRRGSTTPSFSFAVNGKKYIGEGPGFVQKRMDLYFSEKDVGRDFYVLYLPEDPEQNSILPYCFPPDTLKSPPNGWSVMPTDTLEFLIP